MLQWCFYYSPAHPQYEHTNLSFIMTTILSNTELIFFHQFLYTCFNKSQRSLGLPLALISVNELQCHFSDRRSGHSTFERPLHSTCFRVEQIKPFKRSVPYAHQCEKLTLFFSFSSQSTVFGWFLGKLQTHT